MRLTGPQIKRHDDVIEQNNALANCHIRSSWRKISPARLIKHRNVTMHSLLYR